MKDEHEIRQFLNKALDARDNPNLTGMTYEEGVVAALDWVLGQMEEDETPLD